MIYKTNLTHYCSHKINKGYIIVDEKDRIKEDCELVKRIEKLISINLTSSFETEIMEIGFCKAW